MEVASNNGPMLPTRQPTVTRFTPADFPEGTPKDFGPPREEKRQQKSFTVLDWEFRPGGKPVRVLTHDMPEAQRLGGELLSDIKTTIPASWADYEEQFDAGFKSNAWGTEGEKMGPCWDLPEIDNDGFIKPRRFARARSMEEITFGAGTPNPFGSLAPEPPPPSDAHPMEVSA